MRLYEHTMVRIVSLLQQIPPQESELGAKRDILRQVGNILHCAALFDFPETPHLFLHNHPAFTGKEGLLAEDFRLPDEYSYIEDPVSGVALVDLAKNQKGLMETRAFVEVSQAAAGSIHHGADFTEAFGRLVEAPEMFDGSIVIHFGSIGGMEAMLPGDRGDGTFRVSLGVNAVIVLAADGRCQVVERPYAPTSAAGKPVPGGPSSQDEELVARLAGNIRCGMRELAYYQASKDSPDCGVKLVRAGH